MSVSSHDECAFPHEKHVDTAADEEDKDSEGTS